MCPATGPVVGQIQGTTYHAFLYRSGKMIDLTPPGASYSDATAINDRGARSQALIGRGAATDRRPRLISRDR